MKRVWALYRADIAHLIRDPLAIVVMIGIIIIPALYAWFNIAGTWDPYQHTGDLKVAVVNNDEGYQSDLVPLNINMGKTVVGELCENDQFNWVFVDESEALEGVASNAYYAAIIIPKDFSATMMTVFSSNATQAHLTYYTNEKANAIAPHVTGQGANTLDANISESFTKTVDTIALSTVCDLMSFLQSEGVGDYAARLRNTMKQSTEELREAAKNVEAFTHLTEATAALVETSAASIQNNESTAQDGSALLLETQSSLRDVKEALDTSLGILEAGLARGTDAFDGVSHHVTSALDALDGTAQASADTLRATAAEVQDLISSYEAIRRAVADIDPISPAPSSITHTITLLQSLHTSLENAALDLENTDEVASTKREHILNDLAAAKQSLTTIDTSLIHELDAQLQDLTTSLHEAAASATTLSEDVGVVSNRLSQTAGTLVDQLHATRDTLHDAACTLTGAADQLQTATDAIDTALATGDLERVRSIVGTDPTAMANLLSAPVALDRTAVFPIANTGSSMASFYTTLGLWVGSVIMVALMSVTIPPAHREQAKSTRDKITARADSHQQASVHTQSSTLTQASTHTQPQEITHDTPADAVRPWQQYLARFGTFATIALLQAGFACAGDLLFMNIQCEHPGWFMVAGLVAGLVFCNVVYTLVASFGNIGKALAVVLLVMQIAGSGGIFPIQMSAPFFQAIYPFLPFTHAIAALHDCVGGFYGNDYFASLGTLALFLVPSLILGLVLRTPFIRLNAYVAQKLEDTKVL